VREVRRAAGQLHDGRIAPGSQDSSQAAEGLFGCAPGISEGTASRRTGRSIEGLRDAVPAMFGSIRQASNGDSASRPTSPGGVSSSGSALDQVGPKQAGRSPAQRWYEGDNSLDTRSHDVRFGADTGWMADVN